jgi:hypothetical protein
MTVVSGKAVPVHLPSSAKQWTSSDTIHSKERGYKKSLDRKNIHGVKPHATTIMNKISYYIYITDKVALINIYDT